jgi:hypothetical protein
MTGIRSTRRRLSYTRLGRPISIKLESEGRDSDVPYLMIILVQKTEYQPVLNEFDQ